MLDNLPTADHDVIVVIVRNRESHAVQFQMTDQPISPIELLGALEYIRLYARQLSNEALYKDRAAEDFRKAKAIAEEAANAAQ
jgi:hypothetical protein